MEGEREKLLHLDEILHKRVVGQDEAVSRVDRGHPPLARRHRRPQASDRLASCSSARPAWARPSWPRRWPKALFDDEQNMVRIDMTEYMEKFSVSRLIGAPPGIRRLRRGRPAHRGRAPQARTRSSCSTRSKRRTPTCSTSCCRCSTTAASPTRQGRTVDFKNTVIILTSNLGLRSTCWTASTSDGEITRGGARSRSTDLLRIELPARVPQPA